ncbi:hypothetical protein [Streptomyces lavendulae]|uniref:hypothetical protein n=1 Tax=Streptomyces lavendulae TaxID=1914 RepID=UPI0031E63BF5
MGVRWQWRFEDGDGAALVAQAVVSALETRDPAARKSTDDFETQGDAETWIGLFWRPLLDAGVVQVVLLEGGREVYGPMSLAPHTP